MLCCLLMVVRLGPFVKLKVIQGDRRTSWPRSSWHTSPWLHRQRSCCSSRDSCLTREHWRPVDISHLPLTSPTSCRRYDISQLDSRKKATEMGNRYNGQRKIGQWKNVKQEKRQHLRNRWKTATIFLVVHFPVAFFSCRFYLLPTAHMLDTTMYAHSHILYRVILSNGRAK